MPVVMSGRVAGYRASPGGDNDAQLFAQLRTLRIRQYYSLDLSIAPFDLIRSELFLLSPDSK